MSRRTTHRALFVVALSLVAAVAACSFIVDTEQCSTDGDCAARGPTFADTVCREGFCTSPVANDASTEDHAEPARDAEASVDDAPHEAEVDAATPGDTCQTAVVVPLATSTTADASTQLQGQTTVGYGEDYTTGAGCVPGSGPDRIYEVSVPNGRQLTVGLAAGSFDGVINIDSVDGPNGSCSATLRCASGTARGGTASYINAGGQPASVFVVASGSASSPSGSFALDLSIGGFPSGESCRNPISVVPGTLNGQTSVGFANNYSPIATDAGAATCAAGFGADVVYTTTVPSGTTLTVTVVPSGAPAWQPSVNIVPSGVLGAQACDTVPLACAGRGAAATPNGNATAQYVNSGGAAEQVYVIVDSVSPGGAGLFSLQVTN